MNKTNAQHIGQQAETIACNYLLAHGLKLIVRNYRCKLSEIDLIMQDRDYLVFIEVRFRQRQDFGNSSETITSFKQAKLLRAAQFYLQQKKLTDKIPCRFDVIAIKQTTSQPIIEWIKNAFNTF